MKEFYDFRIVRRFLGSKATQMVSVGVIWVLFAGWMCVIFAMFFPMDSWAWLFLIPASVWWGRWFVTSDFGYMGWLEKQRANLRNRIQETLPAGVRFILKDSVEQVNWENKYPGFGEALHKTCIRNFFDAEDVIWVDLEVGYRDYRHFRIDKDAICWFKE